MKVVLDTNVFVSGVFFSGPPHRILKAWRTGRLQLVISPEILEEYSRVGAELAEGFPAIDLRPILDLVTFNAEMVYPLNPPEPVCEDPADDKFFSCAVAGSCKTIISGDKHLLRRSGYGGIYALKPREFVEKILS